MKSFFFLTYLVAPIFIFTSTLPAYAAAEINQLLSGSQQHVAAKNNVDAIAKPPIPQEEPEKPYRLSETDRQMLEKIQRDSFQYFIEQTNPQTGLTKDSSRNGSPASIAATGFAVASFAIGSAHGWISYQEAYRRISKTLKTVKGRQAGVKGFYYHFLDPDTGRRTWSAEVSSIDTALFLAGILLASTYFQGTDLTPEINALYDRVDWSWMLNRTNHFSHGWKPNSGFLPYYWDMYAEHLILQALASGSGTKPVSPEVWRAWKRDKETYNGKEIVYSYTGSLFTYQYSHAFIDFRQLSDAGINYFENSTRATEANLEYSKENATEYKTYETYWGLSASLGPDGYKAYGALPGLGLHDGTIAPYAAIASIVFSPAKSTATIKAMYDNLKPKLYGSYGFRDAFNLDAHWWADEYIGIDQGITLLMLENYLNNDAVWKRFMTLPFMKRWIERAGFEKINLPKTIRAD